MMLMAGKPLLLLPLVLEQGMMARIVQRHGAGLGASIKQPEMIRERLRSLLDSPQPFQQAATKLAAAFAGFNPDRQIDAIVRRIEGLARRARPGTDSAPPADPRIVLLVRRS